MRHLILSVCLVTFVACFISCKKDSLKENQDTSSSIIEIWELQKISGMITINYPAGKGNILKFTKGNYELYENNRLVKNGDYKIVKDSTVEENVCLVFATNRFTDRIIYDNNLTKPKEFLEIENNKLTIISGCYALDGGSTFEYKKK